MQWNSEVQRGWRSGMQVGVIRPAGRGEWMGLEYKLLAVHMEVVGSLHKCLFSLRKRKDFVLETIKCR